MPKRLSPGQLPTAKTGMKDLFAEPKIKKDGTLSKVSAPFCTSSNATCYQSHHCLALVSDFFFAMFGFVHPLHLADVSPL